MAGRQAQIIATQISANDQIAGIMLSPVQIVLSKVDSITVGEIFTSLIKAIAKADQEPEADNTCDSSPFRIVVSIV
jgi:hypothetical protein